MEPEEKKESLKDEVLSFIKAFCISAVVILLFINFIAHPVTVTGRSMVPTLQDKDYGFTSIIATHFGKPERSQIVVFNVEEMKDGKMQKVQLVKRIIGLPGETVECKDDEIYINGEKLDESGYIDGAYRQEMIDTYGFFNKVQIKTEDKDGNTTVETVDFDAVTLGEDEYFVMGDNRPISKDSRAEDIGPITEEQIYGEGIMILFPFGNFGVK